MKLGYIGLGALGSALARRLQSQHPVTVWDMNPEAVARVAAVGASPAVSAAALGQACDVILLCLPRSSDVRQLILEPGGLAEAMAPGTLVIDQTSGIPAETRAIAAELKSRGVSMVDAAVSASPPLAAQGGATLMVAGPDAVFDRALPVLNLVAATIHRCGNRVGDGQAMKMVNNALNGGCRFGTLEIVALGRKMGLSLRTMSDVLNTGSGANQTTEKMLPALVEGRQSTDFALALMLKDLSQAVALGIEFGAPMPVSATVRGLLQVGVNTLGPAARLEDIVAMADTMAATRMAEPVTGPEAGRDVADMIDGAAEALGTALTYECVIAGLKYGLQLEDMARVLVRTSGWSASLRRILPCLVGGQGASGSSAPALPAMVATLQAAAAGAIEFGAPTMILNVVRGVFETVANEAGPGATTADVARFYERSAATSFR